MNTPTPEIIMTELREICPLLAQKPSLEMTVSELQLDSMDTVELLCAVHERFHVRLAESEFQPSHTMADVCRAIAFKMQQPYL